MAKYNIFLKPSAIKELKQLPRKELERITRRIHELAVSPHPMNSRKLSAEERYRIRQGDYRILYSIDDAQHSVTVIKIAHRRDVYR